jgi:O-antigen/teichoic acid export membrane protein
MVEVARKLPLPEGTYAVGAGIAVAGITGYVFLSLAFRQLTTETSKVDYTAVFGLWVILYTLTPGLFQPLEQEVGRALAHRRAQGIGGAPLVKRAATLGGALALVAVAACVAAIVPLTSNWFDDNIVLWACLPIGIVAYFLCFMTRGTLSGNGRFGPYGLIVGAEGVIRLIAVIGLIIVGSHAPGPYGLALAIPPFIALGIGLRGQRGLLVPGPTAPYSELSTALGYLLVGSVLCQALSYAAYIAAMLLHTPSQDNLVGDLAVGILIARIPILGFQAIQASLLPKLARLAGAGRDDEFRSSFRQLVLIVLGVGIVGVVGGFAAGHAVGQLLFGDKFTLSNRDVGLLALGSGAFILALTLAQALIALRSYAAATWSWVLGAVGCVVGVFTASELILRSELSYAIGCSAAALSMWICLVVRLRRGVPVGTMERLTMDLEHEPLEL